MKTIFYIFFLLFPAFCQADTFLMKDGAKIEGEVTGEMDGALLVKTKYGSLTLNRADITEQQAAVPAAASPAIAPATELGISTEAVAAQPAPAAEIAVSTPPEAAAPEAPAVAPPIPAPGLSFVAITPSTSTRLLVYYEEGVAIATETFDAAGALLSLEGAIKDGAYQEYYPEGELKTVKSMAGNKTNGTLRTYYPSGKVQVEAYYLAGVKDGAFKYTSEDGRPLLEASYSGDKLNGLKKEYNPDGTLRSEVYYENDRPTELPKLKDTPGTTQEQDSMLTAKVTELARGERYTFQFNGKYLGKLVLDKKFNVTGQEGKVPDGAVRVYSAEGKLQKEMLFKGNEIKILRVYEDGGPLKATYTFSDGKAKAFALK